MEWTPADIQKLCWICGKPASQRHHKFSQTKRNRATYGSLIDEPFNILPVCADCHTGHNKIPSCYIWNESTFREYAYAYGYNVPEGKKSLK